MTITCENRAAFEKAAQPLIQWIAENVHPHHAVIVTNNSAELLEGQITFRTDKYIRG